MQIKSLLLLTLSFYTSQAISFDPINYQFNQNIKEYTLESKDICAEMLKENDLYGPTYEAILSNPENYSVILYQHNNSIVGLCMYKIQQENSGYISNFAVSKSYQGYGFGTTLLLHAMHNLYQKNCAKVTLHSLKTAESFYESKGFHLSKPDDQYNEFTYIFPKNRHYIFNPETYKPDLHIRNYDFADRASLSKILEETPILSIEHIDEIVNKTDDTESPFTGFKVVVHQEIDGTISGVCIYSFDHPELKRDHIGYILEIAVLSTFQRKGIGKALMDYMISDFYKNECETIELTSGPKTEAYYENIGFVWDGTITNVGCKRYFYTFA